MVLTRLTSGGRGVGRGVTGVEYWTSAGEDHR